MSKSKNKRKLNRITALTIALSVLIVVSIGTTLAFLIVGTDTIVNIFTPSKIETSVIIWDSYTQDGVRCRVRNESDTEAYIRAAVTVNWKKVSANEGEADYVYAIAPVEGVDYSMEWNTNKRWIKHEYSNGEVIYYQVSPVGPKVGNDYADSYPLFNNFKQLSTENQPEGYELVVEVVGSGIQSTPVEVVEEQWGVTISGGNITGVTTN